MTADAYLALDRTERDVLLGIAVTTGEGDADHPHGSVVREWVGSQTGSTPYSEKLYGAIGTLEEEGLIEKVALNGRDTGLVLTESGREALDGIGRKLSQAGHGDNA